MKDSVILQPVVTEKSSNMQSRGQYSFLINASATKVDVKHAIKSAYGADVKNVRIMITPKKVRLLGRGREWTKRDKFKKAIVTLKDGKTIDPGKLGESKAAKAAKTVKDKSKKATTK